jgi:hypothetical protein
MDTISTYFSAERTESLVFITVGLLALLASAACWIVLRKPLFHGMALTLSVVAVLQLVVGITIYQRSPQDTARVQQMLRQAPERIQSEEVPRMRVVMRNFRIYLGVEVALLILALLVTPFAAPGGFMRGAAMGLALQAAFSAMLDLVATWRGEAYLNWLLMQI